MVNVASALVSGQDSTVVVRPLGGISADGDWSVLGKSVVDLLFVLSNRDGLADGVGRSALARSASSVLGGIRVALVGVESSLLGDPSESLLRISSVASLVRSVAINDLLWGKGLNGLSCHQVGRFDSFSGGESPARSALLLVLDRGGHSFGDPVNSARWGLLSSAFDYVRESDGRSTSFTADESIQRGLFAFAPVRVLGEPEGSSMSSSLGLGIELGDLGSIHFEVFESGSAFDMVVGLVPEASVFIELGSQREGAVAWGVNQSVGGAD